MPTVMDPEKAESPTPSSKRKSSPSPSSEGPSPKAGRRDRQCKHEGCTNYSRGKGGVCVKHGANVARKICSHDGCTNQVKKWGVCRRHESEAKVNSSITATPKPDTVASSNQALESTVASIKEEYDEETDSEAADKFEWGRIKQEDTDNEGD